MGLVGGNPRTASHAASNRREWHQSSFQVVGVSWAGTAYRVGEGRRNLSGANSWRARQNLDQTPHMLDDSLQVAGNGHGILSLPIWYPPRCRNDFLFDDRVQPHEWTNHREFRRQYVTDRKSITEQLMIRITCGNCEKTLTVKDSNAGKRGKCPGCGKGILVPPVSGTPTDEPDLPDPLVAITANAASSVVTAAGSAAVMVGNTMTGIFKRSDLTRTVIDVPAADPAWYATFTRDNQSVEVIRSVANKVQTILMTNEELTYIAVQNKPILNFSPDCIALTNKRFIFYRPRILGRVDFEDCVWRELLDANLSENLIGATIRITVASGKTLMLDYIPKAQARAVYRIVQEMEEKTLQERRDRSLEEKRAAAGGVTVQANVALPQGPPTTQNNDPLQKLQQLKSMYEAGLITAAEFEAKKGEILANL